MLQNFEKIYSNVLTGKENLKNKEIQVLCVFHQEKTASLCINVETGVYYCQACSAKGSSIGFYMATRGVDYKTALKELGEFDENYSTRPVLPPQVLPPKPIQVDTDYTKYYLKTARNVHDNYEFFCKKLYEYRGITLPTAIACGIGYDHTKGWIFPIMRYTDGESAKVVGYEVRQKEFKKFEKGNKCFKAENSPSCLAVIYKGWTKEKAYICEGFIDSYFLYQYLTEKANGQQLDVTILTPSMGVKTVPDLVNECELWNDFDKVVFVLDNDPWEWSEKLQRKVSAGNEASDKIANSGHSDKFEFFGGLAESEDFELWYKRKLNE